MKNRLKTAPWSKKLEVGLLISGALMIATFAAFKGWSATQSHSAISAFEEARQNIQVQKEQLSPAVVISESTASLSSSETPDFSLWSDKRVSEYETSLEISNELPQALLKIEHLNINVPVYNGADDLNLNRGVARVLGTAKIGQKGNLAIAGHRDGFFRPLKEIEVGDEFTLETLEGTLHYAVSSITIVDPSEVSVLAPTDTATVTLVTCYPFYFVGNAPKRFIVKGEMKSPMVNS